MQYRSFPKLPDKQISVLGFGMMRLPLIRGTTNIDSQKVREMCKTAFDAGLNYFDTSYVYHDGKSESVLGKTLQELDIRGKVYIADKMPVWLVHKKEDWNRLFEEQLERLQTSYIDFYLMHALNAEYWNTIQKLDGLAFLEQKRAEGKIRHIGFSFHDELDVFYKIIDSYENWDFCQIQYNYLDENHQAGTKGLQYAAAKEIGLIVMEPLRGGLLAQPPKAVLDIFAHADKPRMPAEWAFRWVWEHQEVVTALSGMGALNQVLENCAAATTAKANSLPQSQLKVIEAARDWFFSRIKTPCTGCAYCMPCPQGIPIPDILAEYNRLSMRGSFENGVQGVFSETYRKIQEAGHGSDKCAACAKCEKLCPQHIQISDVLAEVRKILK